MQLYTGYFAKVKDYINAGLEPVSIAGITPSFFKGERWSDFAPRKELFNQWKSGALNNFEYSAKYTEYLNTLPKQDIYELKDSLLGENKNFVMCCYEKQGDFCHRHVLADWLENNFGIRVEEYEIK